MSGDERDHEGGVSTLFKPLVDLIAEAPEVKIPMHLRAKPNQPAPCGSWSSNTTSSEAGVTCEPCKAHIAPLAKARARRAAKRRTGT